MNLSVERANGASIPPLPTDPSTIAVPDASVRSSEGIETAPKKGSIPSFSTNREWAHHWHGYGFRVIPIVPNEKRPVFAYSDWPETLSARAIDLHWTNHPDHEVGCILSADMLVLDTDSPAADEAFMKIAKGFGARTMLIVQTARGRHYYYRLEEGTIAKADSHDSRLFPTRIDVRAGRSSVVLPCCNPKTIYRLHASCVQELEVVDQTFVDAVFKHNGRASPKRPAGVASVDSAGPLVAPEKIAKLLGHIDPDSGYEDWLHALMAIFNASQGSDDGLALADQWSGKGSKYQGRNEIEAKWNSFSVDQENPITIGTLIQRARDEGADIQAIMQADDDRFEQCEFQVIKPNEEPEPRFNPLLKYSLSASVADLECEALEAVPLLGAICLKGQATMIYAPPNTGKTLITLALLIAAIQEGRVAGRDVIYMNADDSSKGLAEKTAILAEYGVHVIAPGFKEFKAVNLMGHVEAMIQRDSVRGLVLILDTAKKLVSLMQKTETSAFTDQCRQFVMRGGTIVAMGHTNKRADSAGKQIYAGTSDVIDDFDAAYIIDVLPIEADKGERVVEFTNKKRRGDNAEAVAYAYAAETGITYTERLTSVREVDPLQLDVFKRVVVEQSDAEIIEAVSMCIGEGTNLKMALVKASAGRAKVSTRAAIQVIERYTGDDPELHRWTYSVQARGGKAYTLLPKPERTRTEGNTPAS